MDPFLFQIILDKKQTSTPPAQVGSDGGAAASGFGDSRSSSVHSGAFGAAESRGSQNVVMDPLLLHGVESF